MLLFCRDTATPGGGCLQQKEPAPPDRRPLRWDGKHGFVPTEPSGTLPHTPVSGSQAAAVATPETLLHYKMVPRATTPRVGGWVLSSPIPMGGWREASAGGGPVAPSSGGISAAVVASDAPSGGSLSRAVGGIAAPSSAREGGAVVDHLADSDPVGAGWVQSTAGGHPGSRIGGNGRSGGGAAGAKPGEAGRIGEAVSGTPVKIEGTGGREAPASEQRSGQPKESGISPQPAVAVGGSQRSMWEQRPPLIEPAGISKVGDVARGGESASGKPAAVEPKRGITEETAGRAGKAVGAHTRPERLQEESGKADKPKGDTGEDSCRREATPERRGASSGRRSPLGRRPSPDGRRSPGRRASPSGRRASPSGRRASPDRRRSPGRRHSPGGRHSPDRPGRRSPRAKYSSRTGRSRERSRSRDRRRGDDRQASSCARVLYLLASKRRGVPAFPTAGSSVSQFIHSISCYTWLLDFDK